ncbi:MAG: MdtA/MuxA family multidrug efflux RND transporter periplasmic adaptor subunit [Deltaproteobacteria bacterium]|nr:MdtA/MuxA family multidrug efflux RND transporter periplasmic adaptor subunit [Deltaproteobacteria bacterium]
MVFTQDVNKNDEPRRTLFRGALRRWWIWLLACSLAIIGGYAHLTRAENKATPQTKKESSTSPKSVPVVAVVAKQGDIKIYLTGLGSVTPLNTVTIKSRVDGQLMKVLFREGQTVSKGYLLAEIDPRPFEAQLTQAQGQMARDRALLENAQVDVRRYQELIAQDSIAKQQLDTQKALVRQYEGTVKIDQGQIENVKLQLIYCRITAPISGRIGLRLVDEGNIVHANDSNGLAVITQLQPITVIFSIPEDSLPPVQEKLKAGVRLPVEALNREQSKVLATGYLLTIDNQIDSTTGTVRLKAEFPNKDNELFPNQFVNARLLLDAKRGTTVVPAAALQRNPQGAFVYIVKEDQTVAARPVTVGPSEGDVISIDKGLSPGELVVLEGAERLRTGSQVEVKVQGAKTSDKGK